MYKKKKIKILITITMSVVIILLLIFILDSKNIINIRPDKTLVPINAKTTSTAATAQDNFTNGGDRSPVNNSKSEGTLQDNKGVIYTLPPESQWIKSKDSAIVVFYPTINSTLKSGTQISGKTAYKEVSFRLIDDLQGVIAQGNIKVVEGKFAGILNFSTQGKNGRLDIFSMNYDGTEKSNVEIILRY